MTTEQANGATEKTQAGQLPLFYKNPVPLDASKHKDLSLKKNFGFDFAKEANAVPVNMIEMPQVCHYYPIAFSPDENANPVAILGLRDNENLFVDEKGQWLTNTYIPSYVRRYPFIFSELPDSDQLTLCIDNSPEVVEKGGENKFFAEENKPSKLSEDALSFCKSYHAAAQQTALFGKTIADSGILIEREAQINVPGNRKISFSGFRIIDEKKLSELDDETFLDWRNKGWLPFIYAHIFSVDEKMNAQWNQLSRLLFERLKDEAA